MPGLMIAMALVLAPAMDSGLKDPWAAAPRATQKPADAERAEQASTGERSADLRNPFEASAPPPTDGADLKNPFEAATPPPTPHSTELRNPFDPPRAPPPAPRSEDLRNPFAGKSPPKRPAPSTERSTGLVDPFQASSARPVEPAPRTESLELRDPFATRPPASHRRAR